MNIEWLSKSFQAVFFYIQNNPYPYAALLLWTLFSIGYIKKAFSNYKSINRYLLQSIPFVFTTIGLVGAVVGCLIFVWNFNANDFSGGIQALFKGVLGSLISALLGIVLSLLAGKIIQLTDFKAETRKALENNELYILKKMLRLMLTTHRRDRAHQTDELNSLDGVRDALYNIYPKLMERLDSLEAAVDGEQEESLAEHMVTLRDSVNRNTDAVLAMQQNLGRLLGHIAVSMTDNTQAGVLQQLQSLRAEQKASAMVLGGKLVDISDKMSSLNTVELGRTLSDTLTQLMERAEAGAERRAGHTASLIEAQIEAQSAAIQAQQSALAAQATALDEMRVALAGTAEEALPVRLDNLRHEQRDFLDSLRREQQTLAEQLDERARGLEERLNHAFVELVERSDTQGRVIESVLHFFDADAQDSLVYRLSALQDLSREQLDRSGDQARSFQEFLTEQTREQTRAVVQAAGQLVGGLEGNLRGLLDDIARQQTRGEDAGAAETKILREELISQIDALQAETRRIGQALGASEETLRSVATQTETLQEQSIDIKGLIERMHAASLADNALQDIRARLDRLSLPVPSNGSSNGSSNGKANLAAKAGKGYEFMGPLGRSMETLITRLKEIESIRSADGKFWRQVEKQMNDGIPIIMGGNKLHLQNGANLDEDFQDRLNKSFLNLNKILETIIEGYGRRHIQYKALS